MPSRPASTAVAPNSTTSAAVAAVLQNDAAITATAAAVSSARMEFYKRELPEGCIPFESAEGKALFAEALRDGTMECYFPLAAQFRTQDEPAFCGLSTLVMTLNALRIDPRRLWKGPWRWFTEDMLDCCRPVEVVREKGIDLDTFACLARCNSAATDVVRAVPHMHGERDFGEEAFREAVKSAAVTSEGEYMVLSYSRKGLGQTGDGHFSPLGGYHAGRDMVLILDVARFKYPPHWVPLPVLWRAMQFTDSETGLPRGYVRLRRLASAPLLLFHLPAVGALGSTEIPAAGGGGGSVCLNKRLNSSLEAGLKAGKAALARAPGPQSGSDALLGEAVHAFVTAFESASQARFGAAGLGGTDLSGPTHNGAAAGDTLSLGGEAGCVDKLSREHISAASDLIGELEATPVFPHVDEALRRMREGAGEAGKNGGAAVTGASSAGHSGGRSCGDPACSTDHAHDRSASRVDPALGDASLILSSSTSPATTAIVTAAVRAGDQMSAGTGAASRTAAAEAAVRAVCETHGLTCIRVKKAHVLTMLVLAFGMRDPLAALRGVPAHMCGVNGCGAGSASDGAGNASLVESTRPDPASPALQAALSLSIGNSMRHASPLLRTEATLIKEQLLSASLQVL